MPKKTKEQPYQIDHDKCNIDVRSMGGGMWMYLYKHDDQAMPFGLLWGTPREGQFYVYGCYVPTWARRQGVMTKLHESVHVQYPVIMTGQGSKEGGAEFIKAYGYKKHPQFGWAAIKKAQKK